MSKPLSPFARGSMAELKSANQALVDQSPILPNDQPTAPPLSHSTKAPVNQTTFPPSDQVPNRPDDLSTIPPSDRETGLPKLDDHSTALDDQKAGLPFDQHNQLADETRFPSRRNKVKIGVRLPAQKVEKYKLWCLLNKVDLQDAVEKGMDWVIGGMVDQPTIRHDDQSTAYQSNDLDNVLTDNIIIFYEKLTKNKWRESDEEAFKEVAHYAPHIIKIGITLSLHRVKNRINSFRYCINAIHETANIETGAPGEDYLAYLLSRLK